MRAADATAHLADLFLRLAIFQWSHATNLMVRSYFTMNPSIRILLRNAAQALMPALLILGSVQLLIFTAKTWIPWEYRRASFPADTYGFSTADRIYLSAIDMDYLLKDLDISYFDDFTLPDGSPMHNERELRHFEDVLRIVKGSQRVFWGALIAVGLSLALLWRFEGSELALESIRIGAIWTLGLLTLFGIGLALAFGVVFTGFHQIFFDPNTWTFLYSDTFIRLYPERFWQDAIIAVVGLTIFDSGILYFITGALLKR